MVRVEGGGVEAGSAPQLTLKIAAVTPFRGEQAAIRSRALRARALSVSEAARSSSARASSLRPTSRIR